jgi:hypothetical protein
VNADLKTEGRLLFLLPHNSENCSNEGTKNNKKKRSASADSINNKRKEKLPSPHLSQATSQAIKKIHVAPKLQKDQAC